MAGRLTAGASVPARRQDASHASAEGLAIGYLRTFVVLLVLAHHSILAYHPFAPSPQASLLPARLPAVAKGSLVFLGRAVLSWSVTAALRRVPAIARVI